MKIWPVQDAKARFSEFLEACRAEGAQLVMVGPRQTNWLTSLAGAGANFRRRASSAPDLDQLP